MIDLSAPAVKAAEGSDAKEIFDTYMETGASKAFEFSSEPDVGVTPAAPAASAPGMGGSTGGKAPQRLRTPSGAALDPSMVPEYEVFTNDGNALTFFMNRHPVLDGQEGNGPFFFAVQNDKIVAGSEKNHVIFSEIEDDILATARERGVVLLIEFENRNPMRCTPCYLVKTPS